MQEDFTIPQYYDRYSDDDHAVWKELYERQMKLLPGRASLEYMQSLVALELDGEKIPRFEDINEKLYKATGWELVAVPGLIPDDTFFMHLATKAFPVTRWIRPREKMDYIQEPDLFHDFFGHVPLLMDDTFARYLAAYGRGGCRARRLGGEKYLKNLARLYWYTVEFGLIKNDDGLRIYGAGILSSKGEVKFCLEDDSPNRLGYDMKRIMQTNYRIDDYQETYWVIDDLEQLFESTQQDFKPIYHELEGKPEYEPGDVLPTDDVIHRGNGSYHNKAA